MLEKLTRVVLPNLNVSARTAVDIRKDSESFEAWRRAVRKIDRDAVNDEPNVLSQRVEDELSTVKEQIEREAFGTALKGHVTRGGLGAAISSAGQIGLEYMLTGESNPLLTVGAGAIGWIGGAFLLPRARGAGRVMVLFRNPRRCRAASIAGVGLSQAENLVFVSTRDFRMTEERYREVETVHRSCAVVLPLRKSGFLAADIAPVPHLRFRDI